MLQSILLQMTPQSISQIALWAGLIGIFYFFMIRPQQKKQSELKKFIENLKKGDVIVTSGGLHGTVVGINENTVTIEVDKGMRLLFDKSSVARMKSTPTE